jgi:hypothetical protein
MPEWNFGFNTRRDFEMGYGLTGIEETDDGALSGRFGRVDVETALDRQGGVSGVCGLLEEWETSELMQFSRVSALAAMADEAAGRRHALLRRGR